MRRGFTLVECMLASAILGLATLALFEGVIVATRIAHENAEVLAAEDYAFDIAWCRMNESYENLQRYNYTKDNPLVTDNIASNAAPMLYYEGSPVKTYTIITNTPDRSGVMISVNVEWGPDEKRKILKARDGVEAEEVGCVPEFFRTTALDRGTD